MSLPTKSICLGTDLPAVAVPVLLWLPTNQSSSTYYDTYTNDTNDAHGPTEHIAPKMMLIGLLVQKI